MLTYRYTSRIETINLIKELHPHCQNKKTKQILNRQNSQAYLPTKKPKKNLRISKNTQNRKKPKGEAINTKNISQGYDISLLKLKLNDEYHTISEIKWLQKTKNKNKRLVRALSIVELYARILNSTLLPQHKPSTEKAKSKLSKTQNPLKKQNKNCHSRSYQDWWKHRTKTPRIKCHHNPQVARIS